MLDVVYNHIGPGNEALTAFGPYFTDRLGETPWGQALDYSQPGVREWALQNAELWVREYGIDGLRLDAVHAVQDDSDRHVLAELAERVRAASPRRARDQRDGRRRTSARCASWGHDAMWLDSLHHALHVALTGEQDGYYADFDGSMASIAAELRRPEGPRIVVCAQNHDQVGNRAVGDRLPDAKRRVAAAVVLFSPFTPLLFQGEEYGEARRSSSSPTTSTRSSPTPPARAGGASSPASPASGGEVPDPQDAASFERSKLTPRSRRSCTRGCSGCGASCRASSRWPSTSRRGRSSCGAAARRCGPTSRNETVELDA